MSLVDRSWKKRGRYNGDGTYSYLELLLSAKIVDFSAWQLDYANLQEILRLANRTFSYLEQGYEVTSLSTEKKVIKPYFNTAVI